MRTRIALAVSLLAHPAIVGMGGLLLAIRNEGLSAIAASTAIVALLLPMISVPVGCQFVMSKMGIISDFYVTRQDERRIYLLVVASILIPTLVIEMHVLSFTRNFTLIVYMLLGGLFTFTVLNLYMKASLHVAVVTAVVVGLAAVYGKEYALGLPVVALVGWARRHLEQHALGELVMAFTVSALIVLAIARI